MHNRAWLHDKMGLHSDGPEGLRPTPMLIIKHHVDLVSLPVWLCQVDILGNIFGNIVGNISGDIFSNIFGNVFGNIFGDIFGNIFRFASLTNQRWETGARWLI